MTAEHPVSSAQGLQTSPAHWLVDAAHANLLLPLANLHNVVRDLHPHKRVHFYSEGFFNAERHVPGKVCLAVEQAGECGPGDVKRRRSRRHREARRRDNLRANEISGVGRVLDGDDVCSFCASDNLPDVRRRFRVLSRRCGTSIGGCG